MIKRKIVPLLSVMVLLLACSGTAWSVTGKSIEQSPETLVKKVLDSVMKIQTDPGLQGHENRYKRAMEIKKIIKENFDSYGMAKSSVQGYWKNIPGNKKKKFSEVFSDLFQDSYTRLVLNFLKKEHIEYLGQQVKDGHATVKTAIVRSNDRILVDYYLRLVNKNNKKWIIEDVSIDGVSIVGNYRSIFRREIARNSFDSLLKKMVIQQKAIKMRLAEKKKA